MVSRFNQGWPGGVRGISGIWNLALVLVALMGLVPSSGAELPESYVTENGIRMVLIRGGTFIMGNTLPTDPETLGQQGNVFTHGGEDERPVRQVTIDYDFYISETEVLASQFTKFQEDHEGTGLFYPYATGISWEDAVRFTEWMNRNEGGGYRDEVIQLNTTTSVKPDGAENSTGITYRLPTEAEWEFVARAGSKGHFSSGNLPPPGDRPNAWGVKNMHTDAIEWVLDWYGDYPDTPETNPVGPASGLVRVVRGGGLHMPYHDFSEKYKNDGRMPFFRRSANRSGAPQNWRGRHNIGFRIVAAALPSTPPRPVNPKPPMQFVRHKNPLATSGPDSDRPWFKRREVMPIPPANSPNPEIAAAGLHHTVHGKNHNPALVVAPNGDLLATYFSASAPAYEDLTDVAIIGMRLRFGAEAWDMPGPFLDIPGTKDIAPVLTRDGDRILFASGGGGMDGIVFRWRYSDDNGATWSPLQLPVILGPRGDYFPQPVSNFLRGSDGTLLLPSDGSGGNTLLWASSDEGITWRDTGGRTGGRHTVFVNRADGAIMGLGGKATEIDGYLPWSVSHDGGQSWNVSRSPFPALGPGGQKPTMIRLSSGRLFLAADWLNASGEQPPEFDRTGAYVALSEDEGKTWIVKDLPGLTPHERWLFQDRPGYRTSPLKDGTLGYAIAAQGPNGLIHLLNSSTQPPLHFEMNEAWILDENAGVSSTTDPLPGSDLQTLEESHPDGSKKLRWSLRADSSGRMLLHGSEIHWYGSGIKEYEVTWSDGRKIGAESHWNPQGQLVWRWNHRPDGVSEWTQFHSDGSIRNQSTWRDGRLLNTSLADGGPEATCTSGYDGPPEALFPTFADADTVLLWTFDDPEYPNATLTDAGGNEYDLRLMDGGDLAPGVYGTALHFASRPGYEVSFAGWQGAIANERMREEDGVPSGEWSPSVAPKNLIDTWVCGVWTLDLRLRLTDVPSQEAALLDMGDAYDPGFAVLIEAGGRSWRITNHYTGRQTVIGDTSGLLDGDWHHVALVRQYGEIAAYIDGRRLQHVSTSALARQPVPPYLPPDLPGRDNRGFTADTSHEWRRAHRFNLSLGEDRRKRIELTGAIDELRVSKIARYEGDFDDPGSFSRNYGPDAPTAERPVGPPLLFGPVGTDVPIPIGSRKHVFIDMALIETHERVNMKVNSLKSTERLQVQSASGRSDLIPDGSRWRESFIDHDGKILLFISDGYSAERGATYLFESQDGVNFHRPVLGLIESDSDPNLILDKKPWGSIAFKDSNPDAGHESRFKVSSFTSNRGIYLYHSPDAMHWRRNEVAMLPLSVGGDAQVFWDDQRGVYFAHMKRSSGAPSNQGPPGRATVMFMTTEPFKAWPFNKLARPHFESWPFPLLSDEGTTVVQPRVPIDEAGDLDRLEEVYRPQALKYAWAPDVYLAMPHRSFFEGGRQHTSTELAVSRDGERWTDYAHSENGWYMPPFGTVEDRNVTEALSLYGIIRRGDELWVYVEYTTDAAPNGKDGPKRYARLRQKLDRFVAINAGRSAGWVVTHPLVFEGNALEVNVDAGLGTMKIAILDENGADVPGFTLSEFDAVHRDDALRHRASWGGRTDLGSLAGETVRLKFWLENAKLYAMQFVQ